MTSTSNRGLIAPQRNASAIALVRGLVATIVPLVALAMCAAVASAQQQPAAPVRLSLDDALRLAQQQSQAIEIARAGVTRASGQKAQARSQYMPQLSANVGYTKTLASQFSSFASAIATPKDTTKTTGGTSTSGSSSSSGGFNISQTSFGATNQYVGGINLSQSIYSGGRIQAQNHAADAQLRSAGIEVTSQRAQASLDVTSAYYDAVLADQLVSIADSSVAQTKALLDQTRVGRQVGNVSEYELLRAQVTYENQLPVEIQAKSNRDVAYLHLAQLLNMSLDTRLELTTGIDEPATSNANEIAAAAGVDTAVIDRAPVRELDEAVRAQEEQVKVAKAERIPTLSLTSAYQRLYFPPNAVPSISSGVNNWTVGLATSFPIFDGGKAHGDILVAQAGVQQARAQREQTRQFAALDTRVALNQLAEATSSFEASKGTADQAQRAYGIDQVRYREGISTQTDLAQSRLLLEQALANRAQAARNFAVARMRLSLLKDLPLQSGTSTPTSASGAAGAVQSQSQQQQQQAQQTQAQSQQPMTSQTQSAPAGAGAPPGSIQP